MKEIPLTQGKVALVDDTDFDWLNQWKWTAQKIGHNWYATRHTSRRIKFGTIYIHSLILGGKGVDHINRDGLDNRRSNLRFATKSMNSFNSRLYSTNTSGFRGVIWLKRDRKWRANIEINGKRKTLGYFDSMIDAVTARMQAEKQLTSMEDQALSI